MEQTFLPSLIWVVPFAALLLSLAIVPLVAPHFWEPNRNKLIVSLVLGLPVLALYLMHEPEAILDASADYISFMALLGSLYVISGGILVDGDIEATPAANTSFLAIGALAASVIGTTGASMLLIRPLLRTNSERRHVVHTVVFFIFLVSNVGGCLTPLGDPPLFLGYLAGVPFTWTLRLAPAWFLTVATLLVIYYVWDRVLHAREPARALRADRAYVEPIGVRGKTNVLLLGGIVASAALLASPWREGAMIALAAAGYFRTPRAIHHANHFSFGPILEVAVVFVGIFSTMIPALAILRASSGALGLREAWQFFWVTGGLSSFLDNAPTYLTLLAVGQGQGMTPEVVQVPHHILAAISLGAVFMGANTYIGNGPNFMVRAIAEGRGVRMPGFGGYMAYSACVLLPVFAGITVVFFGWW